jgi:hypothetical protein
MTDGSSEPFLVVIDSEDSEQEASSEDLCCKDGFYTTVWTGVILCGIGIWIYVFYLLVSTT